MNVPTPQSLVRIGWDATRFPALSPLREGQQLARVVAQHRNSYQVHDGERVFAVHARSDMTRNSHPDAQRPGVGDWVLVLDGTPPILETLLPRTSALVRAAAGKSHRQQMIAANVDWAFIVCGLDQDFNLRRIERYLVLVAGGGVRPALIFTKADRCPDLEEKRAQVRAHVAPSIPTFFVDARRAQEVHPLCALFPAGQTAVLVGSSGAGKSTLTNTWLGEHRQATAQVRAHDDRGRHTTTQRVLVSLPHGGCLIDTPGMRELKLTGDEPILPDQWQQIEELAGQCRFRDCRHQSEPGCQVRLALQEGRIPHEQYLHYGKMLEESAAAKSASVQRQRGRSAHPRPPGKRSRH